MHSLSSSDAADRLQSALSARYRVQRELGRGATARVFLATDLKHDRQVAIKLLNPELIGQLGAERFLREIRVTASLQHPHILPLYDSGDAEGLLYYVTSYVEGESLRTRLQRERILPIDEAVAIVRTLAMTLDFAHRQGVVHRDIKPENILLQDGQPVLADFGIALALSRAADDRVTEAGLSVGTPHYMSPEQAAGSSEIGSRSDIYSLGAVAYEMLIGEPPVTGPTREAILSRIAVEAPRAIIPVRHTVAPVLERAILKALAKNPVDRFRTASAFASAIEAAGTQAVEVGGSGGRRRPRLRVFALAGGVAGLIAIGYFVSDPPNTPSISVPTSWRQLTFSGDVRLAALSPDGRSIAYTTRAAGRTQVLVQDVQGGTPDTIAMLPAAYTLEWSPDGGRLLIGGHSQAVVISRYGGTVRSIEAATRFPAYVLAHWLPEGLRVSLHKYADKRVLVVNLETEDTVALPVPGSYTWMEEGAWSPDGTRFAVSTQSTQPPRWAIRVVTIEGTSETILEDTVPIGAPRWAPGGRALYFSRRGQAIERLAYDGKGSLASQTLQSRVDALPGAAGTTGRFSPSRDGRYLVLVKGAPISNLEVIQVGGNGQQQTSHRLTTGTAMRWSPATSPDGRWLAFVQQEHGTSELMRMPIAGGPATVITRGAEAYPRSRIAWSPSGEEIAFTSARPEGHQVIVVNVSTGRMQRFPNANVGDGRHNLAWAPGSAIAYQRAGNRSIHLLDPARGGEQVLIADEEGFVHAPAYSPDGRQLAVTWNRGAHDEGIWVVGVKDTTRRRLQAPSTHAIRTGGPYAFGWSFDGRSVYATAGRALLRLDAYAAGPPDTMAVQSSPLGSGQCTLASRVRPDAFVCVTVDLHSDVWMIENFDPSLR